MTLQSGQMGGPVLTVGSVALDSVRTPFGEVEEELGGAACYASVSASFFTPARMVAVIGEDFPDEYIAKIGARGVDLAGLQRVPGKTFRWWGYYEYDLNQAHTVKTELNVFEGFRPTLPEDYRTAPYVFLANIDPVLQLSVLDQVRRPKLVACDTMNYWIENTRGKVLEVLARCDIALMNEAEAREAGRHAEPHQFARRILNYGPGVVIIKKGEHGSMMLTQDSYFTAPGYPLEEVKDPTGAGDTFAWWPYGLSRVVRGDRRRRGAAGDRLRHGDGLVRSGGLLPRPALPTDARGDRRALPRYRGDDAGGGDVRASA